VVSERQVSRYVRERKRELGDRASARSFFARFLFPRLAAVCAGSARCTVAPTRRSSSATNRQLRRCLQRNLEILTT
jgi:hypothetical protein